MHCETAQRLALWGLLCMLLLRFVFLQDCPIKTVGNQESREREKKKTHTHTDERS